MNVISVHTNIQDHVPIHFDGKLSALDRILLNQLQINVECALAGPEFSILCELVGQEHIHIIRKSIESFEYMLNYLPDMFVDTDAYRYMKELGPKNKSLILLDDVPGKVRHIASGQYTYKVWVEFKGVDIAYVVSDIDDLSGKRPSELFKIVTEGLSSTLNTFARAEFEKREKICDRYDVGNLKRGVYPLALSCNGYTYTGCMRSNINEFDAKYNFDVFMSDVHSYANGDIYVTIVAKLPYLEFINLLYDMPEVTLLYQDHIPELKEVSGVDEKYIQVLSEVDKALKLDDYHTRLLFVPASLDTVSVLQVKIHQSLDSKNQLLSSPRSLRHPAFRQGIIPILTAIEKPFVADQTMSSILTEDWIHMK